MAVQPHYGALLADAVNYTKHLLAGALSAVVSRTCCAPLERVKMQMIFIERTGSTMQVARGLLREEGLQGFWRGNGELATPPCQLCASTSTQCRPKRSIILVQWSWTCKE